MKVVESRYWENCKKVGEVVGVIVGVELLGLLVLICGLLYIPSLGWTGRVIGGISREIGRALDEIIV